LINLNPLLPLGHSGMMPFSENVEVEVISLSENK